VTRRYRSFGKSAEFRFARAWASPVVYGSVALRFLIVTNGNRVVLVVEDDESIRNVITDVLEERGFNVHGAANGIEALDTLDAVEPDVMVLDLLMPGMHGWDFMESYAEHTGGKSIPIVVVSVNPALPRSFSRFGVRSVVGKPFDVDELAASVEEALS